MAPPAFTTSSSEEEEVSSEEEEGVASEQESSSWPSPPLEKKSTPKKSTISTTSQPHPSPRSGTKRPNENNRRGRSAKTAKGADPASNNEFVAAEDNGKKADAKKHVKSVTKGKNGKDPKFTKLVFELPKKIWGSERTTRNVEQKFNGKASNIEKGGSSKNVAYPQVQLTSSPYSKGVDQNPGSILSMDQMTKYSGLSEGVVKRGLESLEASKKTELEDRWKNICLLELELVARRAELILDQAKLTLEIYGASND